MRLQSQAQTSSPGFDGRLLPGDRPALLVIDLVKAYVTPGSPLYADYEAPRQACIELLAMCRGSAMPIVFTNVSYAPGGRDGGVFFRKLPALECFEQGVHPGLCEFVDGIQPRKGELVITKQYASAFFGTTLASTLCALSVDTLLICGLSTSGCVRASAVDCCQHGFIPLVVREAVGDRAPGPHEANLFDLQAKYAEVVSLEQVRGYLAQLARAPP